MSIDKEFYQYLPAIHQSSPDLRELLHSLAEHFGTLDELLATSDQKVDPNRAKEEELDWLAQWVDLALEEDWEPEKKRRLLWHVLGLYRLRGTTLGLKRYLENYTNLNVAIQEIKTRGSFQIGVTSRIGGFTPCDPPAGSQATLPIVDGSTTSANHSRDYYLVLANEEGHLRAIFAADQVERIEMHQGDVQPFRFTLFLKPNASAGKKDNVCCFNDATIVRRDDLPGPRRWEDEDGNLYEYHGDPISEVETPYTIAVTLSGPTRAGLLAQLAQEKVRLTEALYTGSRLEATPLAAYVKHLQRDEYQRVNAEINHKFVERKRQLAQTFTEISQQPGFDDLCRLDLAEEALMNSEQADVTEIKRYHHPGAAPAVRTTDPQAQATNAEKEQEINRVRAMLDREKPLHIDYVLRFAEEEPPPRPVLQIGVHSRIGVSTIIA